MNDTPTDRLRMRGYFYIFSKATTIYLSTEGTYFLFPIVDVGKYSTVWWLSSTSSRFPVLLACADRNRI